jgi:hypothetical protein
MNHIFKIFIFLVALFLTTPSFAQNEVKEKLVNKVSSRVKIAPNPVDDEIFIHLEADQKNKWQIDILNTMGQLIKQVIPTVNEGKEQDLKISTEDLENGIFILSVKDEYGELYSQRFIVKH